MEMFSSEEETKSGVDIPFFGSSLTSCNNKSNLPKAKWKNVLVMQKYAE